MAITRDMTTADLVRIVGKRADVAQKATLSVIQSLHKVYAEELSQGHTVALSGIGMLLVKTLPSRNGVNPRTGAKIKVAARNRIAFKSYPSIKKQINGED